MVLYVNAVVAVTMMRVYAASVTDWVWALPILWVHGEYWTCVCVWIAVSWMVYVGSG